MAESQFDLRMKESRSRFHQHFTREFGANILGPIFWRQKLQSCILGWKFFGAKILAQNARVKC